MGLFGGDPPYQVVVGLEAMRVLQGDLCLPHTAEPVQGLRGYRRLAAAENVIAEVFQFRASPGEARVPRAHVADGRVGRHSGEPGTGGRRLGQACLTVERDPQRVGCALFAEP